MIRDRGGLFAQTFCIHAISYFWSETSFALSSIFPQVWSPLHTTSTIGAISPTSYLTTWSNSKLDALPFPLLLFLKTPLCHEGSWGRRRSLNWPEKHNDVYYGLISTKIENFTNILFGNHPPLTAGYKGYSRHQFEHHVFANIHGLSDYLHSCLGTL